MKYIRKSICSLLLCVSMLAVLLTGCSGGKGTAATGNARILIATCAKGDAFRDMLIAALESACDEQGIGHDTVYAEQSAEQQDRKSTRLNSSHKTESRMPSSA